MSSDTDKCACGALAQGRDKFGTVYCEPCWEMKRLKIVTWIHNGDSDELRKPLGKITDVTSHKTNISVTGHTHGDSRREFKRIKGE